MARRIVVGITGASGVIYGVTILRLLAEKNFETHLILSQVGKRIIEIETDYSVSEVEAMAHYTYNNKDMEAAPASGSFITNGMVVAPCTVKTLSGIANSYTNNLLIRAADVTLKEKRKSVLKMSYDAVQYAKTFCEDVEFSPEDSSRTGISNLSTPKPLAASDA